MSVFIDSQFTDYNSLTKAFNIIQHEKLIKKLVNLNFSNSSIKIILISLINK